VKILGRKYSKSLAILVCYLVQQQKRENLGHKNNVIDRITKIKGAKIKGFTVPDILNVNVGPLMLLMTRALC